MNKVWILTSEVNEYDQRGDYFVAVFLEKPTHQDLRDVLPEEDEHAINHIFKGGGRRGTGWTKEYCWFDLRELECKKNHWESEK